MGKSVREKANSQAKHTVAGWGRIIRGAMTEEYLRTIAAHFHALLVMQLAHDLFGKSLFQLTPEQDKECQDRAYGMVRFCYVGISPEAIRKLATLEPPPRIQ